MSHGKTSVDEARAVATMSSTAGEYPNFQDA